MEKCVYLLDEILSLNTSDVKAIMDSGLNAQELISLIETPKTTLIEKCLIEGELVEGGSVMNLA